MQIAESDREEHLGLDAECVRERAQLFLGQPVPAPLHVRQLTPADADGACDFTTREARELPDRPQAGTGVLRACPVAEIFHEMGYRPRSFDLDVTVDTGPFSGRAQASGRQRLRSSPTPSIVVRTS